MIQTPLGPMRVDARGGVVVAATFDATAAGDASAADEALVREAEAQLRAYFDKKLARFDLPLGAAGTPFQRRVWDELLRIPTGTTTSYGAMAAKLGSVARAVGTANGSNPIAVIVPCHRVIGGNGDLTGYAGGLERKRWLLLHEGALLA